MFIPRISRRCHSIGLFVCLSFTAQLGRSAVAQTVINVPPDVAPPSISSGTTINVLPSGELPNPFVAESGSTVNIVGGSTGFNFVANGANVQLVDGIISFGFQANAGSMVEISGGRMDSFDANDGSIINISGGSIDFGADANAGSTVNISGGTIGRSFGANDGSIVTFSGGYVEGDLRAGSGSHVALKGGIFGDDFKAGPGAELVFHGEDFRVDGQLIPGLDTIGNEVPFSLPLESQFTGTLADGTPFSFAYYDDDDQIHRASITLVRAAAPPIPSRRILLPDDPIPTGVRAGQTLLVSEGAVLGDDFHAGRGSTVLIQGGSIGNNFEAAGANVNVTGGAIGYGFGVFANSNVNISGDSVVESVRVLPAATVQINGGHVDSFYALENSTVRINGGTMAQYAVARPGANVVVSGDDFRLNGVPVAGLDDVGSSVAVDLPSTYQLTGTLSDGTPFAFASGDGDRFEDSLMLVRASTPPIETGVISVPNGPPPRGVRSGQTLVVGNSGFVGDHFNAGIGSTVVIDGGIVGDNFEATGSVVYVRSGQVGDDFDAFAGTTVHVEGGDIGQRFSAEFGSAVNISGGHVRAGFAATDGAKVVIRGGFIDGFTAQDGAEVTISGGYLALRAGLHASAGSSVELLGTSFLLDGLPIDGLQRPGDSILLPNRDGELLRATLSDGTLAFLILQAPSRGTLGNVSPGSELRLTLVPEPGSWALAWVGEFVLIRTFAWRRRLPAK